MRERRTILMMGALGLLMVSAPIVAHHRFSAEFDVNLPVTLEGTIVRLEWVNPHAWIHLEVSRVVQGTTETIPADPSQEVWRVETGSPNMLVARGLRRECLPFGAQLTIDGYQAREREVKRANGRDVAFPDGSRFFLGSSVPDAPRDGAETRGNRPVQC